MHKLMYKTCRIAQLYTYGIEKASLFSKKEAETIDPHFTQMYSPLRVFKSRERDLARDSDQ